METKRDELREKIEDMKVICPDCPNLHNMSSREVERIMSKVDAFVAKEKDLMRREIQSKIKKLVREPKPEILSHLDERKASIYRKCINEYNKALSHARRCFPRVKRQRAERREE